MTEEIIKTLQSQSNNFKIVCLGGIMEKGRISLHISSSRLIDPSTDDCITVKYENEEMNCFITFFIFIIYTFFNKIIYIIYIFIIINLWFIFFFYVIFFYIIIIVS